MKVTPGSPADDADLPPKPFPAADQSILEDREVPDRKPKWPRMPPWELVQTVFGQPAPATAEVEPTLLWQQAVVPVAAGSGGSGVSLVAAHDLTGRLHVGEKRFPFRGGVLRAVVEDDYADSFGFQWNRFEVCHPADVAVLEERSGLRREQFAGLLVLDAGCGGGRYARAAASLGARVVAVDRSRAVDKAVTLLQALPATLTAAPVPPWMVIQADLTDLPMTQPVFDLVFSNGVLHHGPDPHASFAAIARLVKPGGRLSVWLYRRNTWWQEWINNALRRRAQNCSRETLLKWCRRGAFLGGVPFLGKLLNKIVSFSAHPDAEIRLCDTFDWYSPRYQSHHTPAELRDWFARAAFTEITEILPPTRGMVYRKTLKAGLLPGSGVNFSGIRPREEVAGNPETCLAR